MRRPAVLLLLFLLLLLLAALPGAASAAQAQSPEQRFPRSAQQAAQDGYRLIGQAELRELLAAVPPPLIIDARPDYEYRQGHIPGALSVPFEPGEAHGLAPDKKARLQHELGPDKERTVVVYCRAPQ